MGDSLADKLTTVLVARYAALLAGWEGEPSEEFHRNLRALSALTGDVVRLRRGAHNAARLRVDRERWETEQAKAASMSLVATQMWPMTRMLLLNAFGGIYKQQINEAGRIPSELLEFLSTVTPEQAKAAGVSAEELQDVLQFGIEVNQGLIKLNQGGSR